MTTYIIVAVAIAFIGGIVIRTINFIDMTAKWTDKILPEPFKVWNYRSPFYQNATPMVVKAKWGAPEDGLRKFVLLEDIYYNKWSHGGDRFCLPKGFCWNGASSPANRQRGLTASLVHDYYYSGAERGSTRLTADRQFACDMRFHDNQPLARVWLWYLALRWFGSSHWLGRAG